MGCSLVSTKQPEDLKAQNALSLSNYQLLKLKPVPTESDIFSLPDAEKKKFLGAYNSFIDKGIRADKALYKYLENSLTGYTYDGNTHIANMSLDKQKGNCISLAILTQAYANIAGIETSFREVSTFPIFKKEKNLLLISSHFSTKLYAPKDDIGLPKNNSIKTFSFGRAGTIVDYFPQQSTFYVGNVQYPSLVAKFYANLSSIALVEEKLNLSFSLAIEALKFRPEDPELINLIAVIHRRAGDNNTAKKLFEFAVNNNLTSSNLFASYHYFAKSINDVELANKLALQLEKSAKTPFDFLQIARNEIKKSNFLKAEKIINSIIENHYYLPEPYFELARVRYLSGQKSSAKRPLEKAIQMSNSKEMIGLYESKLKALELAFN